jgi:hypothetical protein
MQDHLWQFRPKCDQILEMLCKTWKHLIIIYIWLAFGCLDGGTWQVITNMAKTVMKMDTHTQLAPINQTKYKKLSVPF